MTRAVKKKLKAIAENTKLVYDAGIDVGKAEGGDTTEILDIFITSLKKKGYNATTKGDFSDTFNSSLINDELLLEVMERIDSSEILLAYRIFSSAKNIRDALYTGSWDFSQCQSLNAAFSSMTVQKIKKIDARKTIRGHNGMANMFFDCTELIQIDEFYPSAGTNMANFDKTFYGCEDLVELNFMSEISQIGLDLSYSPSLNKKSIKSIISMLSDTTEGLTVTLPMAAVDREFETSEGANDGSESAEWKNLIAPKTNTDERFYWYISLI